MKTTTFGALALCILLSGATSLTAQQSRDGLLGQLKDTARRATDPAVKTSQPPDSPAGQAATVATAVEPAPSEQTASDGVDGKWKSTTGSARLTLKTDGHKLTGEMAGLGRGPMASMGYAITDGAVNGNEISFNVTTRAGKYAYKGALSGGELHLQVIRAGSSDAQPVEQIYVRAQ